MPQQLFPFSYTLGPISRVEGAFPLSFYSMIGVGNLYTFRYSPQSTWSGVGQYDMLLAERKKQVGILNQQQGVADQRRRQGILSKQLLAGHNKVMLMIPDIHSLIPSDRIRQYQTSLLVSSVTDRTNTKKQAALTDQIAMSHSSTRRAFSTEQPIMSRPTQRSARHTMTPVFEAITKRTGLLIDTIVNTLELKHREAVRDDTLFTLSHPDKRVALISQQTLDTIRTKLYGIVGSELSDRTFRKENNKSVIEQSLETRYGTRDIVNPSIVDTRTETAVKTNHTSLLERQVILAVPPYIKSVLREDFILGKIAPHHLRAPDDIMMGKVQRLFATEIQPTIAAQKMQNKFGHLQSEALLGRDAMTLVRPAMGDFSTDVRADILDGYTQVWKSLPDRDDRTDFMIIPSRDFPYQDNATKLMDRNGVPLDPLSDPSIADVQVRYALDHPFPKWAAIGDKEIWVKLTYLKGMILSIIQVWRGAKMKLAGMTMLEAMNYLLDEHYNSLLGLGGMVSLEQYRVFRLGRWFAERIVMHDSAIVLHREYDPWSDKLRMVGSMNAPVTLSGFAIDSNTGVLQTISPHGEVNLTVTNYVNGEFSVSASVPSGTTSTTLIISVDGDVKRVLAVGQTLRMNIPVKAGTHQVKITWNGDSGQALLSGFVLTGAVFVRATTSFKDPKDLQGNMAVNRLIGDMMKYYQDHWDLQKNKGSKGIRQRKPWLTI